MGKGTVVLKNNESVSFSIYRYFLTSNRQFKLIGKMLTYVKILYGF